MGTRVPTEWSSGTKSASSTLHLCSVHLIMTAWSHRATGVPCHWQSRQGCQCQGGEWTEEMSAKAMARVDTDGGGSIDVDEFCDFFVKTMPKNRTHEQFRKLMTRYMAAAIAGRASYYFEEGKALREAADAEAQKRSEMYIHKQERHLKRRCQYARAAEYAAE